MSPFDAVELLAGQVDRAAEPLAADDHAVLVDADVDLLTRQALRIDGMPRRYRLRARERPVFVDQVVPAAVDHQQAAQFRIGGLAVKGDRFGVALFPEDQLQVLAGVHQLVH